MIELRPVRRGEGHLILGPTREIAETHWGGKDAVKATAQDFEDALFCANPIVGAQMAFCEGVFAGSAFWHRSFSTNYGKEIMYLEDIAVMPDFRRKGVGEALLKSVAQVAVSRGYPKVFWLMMQWNSNARKLYERVGAEVEDGNCYCSLTGQALADLAERA
ncbi:MAG: GNAT family N-acetyltransferase [Alphaproteobacteria bacterium]|nr:GNAT family N-acetyltransferase [Alphaproteobacteria bacterium]